MSAAAWGFTTSIFLSILLVFIYFFDRSIAKPVKIYIKNMQKHDPFKGANGQEFDRFRIGISGLFLMQ